MVRRQKVNRNLRIATSFNGLDFHDDALSSVEVHTPRSKAGLTSVNIELLDDSTEAKKVLSFRGCANLRFIMDFDVLTDNWFAQTDGVSSKTDLESLRRFVRAQTPHWRVQYMKPTPSNKPTRRKLSAITHYVLFKVRFFGGTIEVLAKNFALKRR
jgi:hypothetical protein